ncbi:ABC transporter permease [Paenibacillus rigui]|uniref:ABC transporter permease n=1 Tax=Paenibacillus rigui TaxID=554312 RepID=A0A229UNN6_9BACL|nr:ABC transporter permease [Paenibacillus rigui]OXM85000.1 ABC transporter permease [Paenibacillus rigui]
MSGNKRALTYGNVLLFVLVLNFFLPRLLPGGPIDYILGGENGAVLMSEAQKTALLGYYQLDKPMGQQFLHYVKGLVTLDFGPSITYKSPALEVIKGRLPWTLLIVGSSAVLSILIGLGAGLMSAWRHAGRADRALLLSMVGLSAIPEFLIGMLLLIGFSVQWSWFPLGGASTPFLPSHLWWDRVGDVLRHATLPILTLTAAQVASLYLFMRNEAVRVLQEPFVEFAWAKGLNRRTILLRHAARNALLPIVTMITLRIGGLMAGSVLAETVFSYPGIGRLLQEAILSRDYPLLHALFLVMTVFVLLLNMMADAIYPRLDPRVGRGNGDGPAMLRRAEGVEGRGGLL